MATFPNTQARKAFNKIIKAHRILGEKNIIEIPEISENALWIWNYYVFHEFRNEMLKNEQSTIYMSFKDFKEYGTTEDGEEILYKWVRETEDCDEYDVYNIKYIDEIKKLARKLGYSVRTSKSHWGNILTTIIIDIKFRK